MKVNIIAQYHPAAALHQPRLWAVMLNDWQSLPQKIDASFTIANSNRLPRRNSLTNKYENYCECAVDTESDPEGGIGQWSIAYRDPNDKRLYVVPLVGRTSEWHPPEVPVVMHNAKWDLRVLQANKLPQPPNVVDTMIAAYCMGFGRQDIKDRGRSGDKMVGGLGLKYLARRHLGLEMKSWLEVKDKPPDVMAEYNALDSVATLLLWEQWKPKLPQHFWNIDMPLLPVLMTMEDRGITVDPHFLKGYADHLDEQLSNIDLRGINPYSSEQVASYIYNTLGVEPTKFTDSKKPSTDKEVLETIDDPIVKRILEYREFYKEKRTYVSAYASKMDMENRVHCEFKQTSTVTGRLSSANPNLQNVTRGTELRKLFVAPKGKMLVRLDFSQLELRVFAAIANENVMLKTLEEGRSIHQETADQLGIDYDDAKTVNFLMLYGGGAWKMSQEFRIPIDKAKAMIVHYYKAFPGIKQFHDRQIEQAHNERKVVNWFGRTRRLDGMYSEHWKTVKDTEREAINTPVQGAAAEIVKLAMIDLHYGHNAPMLLQVHDELLFEVDEKDATNYVNWLREYVPAITKIAGVGFPIEVGAGKTWKEAKAVAK